MLGYLLFKAEMEVAAAKAAAEQEATREEAQAQMVAQIAEEDARRIATARSEERRAAEKAVARIKERLEAAKTIHCAAAFSRTSVQKLKADAAFEAQRQADGLIGGKGLLDAERKATKQEPGRWRQGASHVAKLEQAAAEKAAPTSLAAGTAAAKPEAETAAQARIGARTAMANLAAKPTPGPKGAAAAGPVMQKRRGSEGMPRTTLTAVSAAAVLAAEKAANALILAEGAAAEKATKKAAAKLEATKKEAMKRSDAEQVAKMATAEGLTSPVAKLAATEPAAKEICKAAPMVPSADIAFSSRMITFFANRGIAEATASRVKAVLDAQQAAKKEEATHSGAADDDAMRKQVAAEEATKTLLETVTREADTAAESTAAGPTEVLTARKEAADKAARASPAAPTGAFASSASMVCRCKPCGLKCQAWTRNYRSGCDSECFGICIRSSGHGGAHLCEEHDESDIPPNGKVFEGHEESWEGCALANRAIAKAATSRASAVEKLATVAEATPMHAAPSHNQAAAAAPVDGAARPELAAENAKPWIAGGRILCWADEPVEGEQEQQHPADVEGRRTRYFPAQPFPIAVSAAAKEARLQRQAEIEEERKARNEAYIMARRLTEDSARLNAERHAKEEVQRQAESKAAEEVWLEAEREAMEDL